MKRFIILSAMLLVSTMASANPTCRELHEYKEQLRESKKFCAKSWGEKLTEQADEHIAFVEGQSCHLNHDDKKHLVEFRHQLNTELKTIVQRHDAAFQAAQFGNIAAYVRVANELPEWCKWFPTTLKQQEEVENYH